MDISLIGVPIMYGCDKNGPQYAPATFRNKGIMNLIKKHNHNVYDLGDLYIENIPSIEKYRYHNKIKYFKSILEMNNNLAHLVFSALSSKSFPFIMGGDHSLGLGSISGASRYYNELAVIWIDAHGDLNSCETSPSGNAHGMPLGLALGIGDSSLVNTYYDGPKIDPKNVYIIGARDLDKGEIQISKKLNLNLYTMDKVRKAGINNIVEEVIQKIYTSNIKSVHLSFDIDVMDKNLVPGTGTPVNSGFNLDEGKKILKSFLDTGLIKSMDFAELNPILDENDITINLCMDLIDWIFKYLK